MLQSLSLPCMVVDIERGLFCLKFGRGGNYASQGSVYNPLPVIQFGRWQVSPPPHGNRCPCLVAACRMPSAVIKGNAVFSHSNICIYTTNRSFSYRLVYTLHNSNHNSCTFCTIPYIYCLLSVPHVHFQCFCACPRLYSSGFSISGSCKAALCFSAIC